METEAFIFVHVGRIHAKFPLKSKENIDAILYLCETKELLNHLLQRSKKELEIWNDLFEQQTLRAIENNEYVIEIGSEITPLIPHDWNEKHGYSKILKNDF